LKTCLLSVILLLSALVASSQSILDSIIVRAAQPEPLVAFLHRTEEQHAVRFFFDDNWLSSYQVTPRDNGNTLRTVLTSCLQGSDIRFSLDYGYAVVFVKDPRLALERESAIRTALAEKRTIEQVSIGDRATGRPGANVVISGTVREESSDAGLSDVAILVNDKEFGSTGVSGAFRLDLLTGEYLVRFRYPDYSEKIIDLSANTTGRLDIRLEAAPLVLEEVVIAEQAVENRRVGQTFVRMSDLKRAPSFLGEVDVIKQIQNQPGVTTVGEVATGFNVRGGGVDQNLVLFDGTPVFNTSHALGFFSAFNADAINNVTFSRSGISAEYGGRVSSVLDIVSKEGDGDRWTAGGGIGILSSHISAGGPLRKDTTTLNFSVRASYSDWILNVIESDYDDLQESSMVFYDGTLKVAHAISQKTKVILSAYSSFDRYSLTNDTLYTTRNLAASLKVNHTFNDRLFGSVTLGFGQYGYTMHEPDPETAFDMEYSISYPTLNFDFNYDGAHKLSFGFHNSYYSFAPASLAPASPQSNANTLTFQNERSLTTAIYLSDVFNLNDRTQFEVGLRLSLFNAFGPATVYSYEPGKPIEVQNQIDSAVYSGGEVIKTYWGAEPRVSIQYMLSENASIKIGYNRMYQYVHLISNTAAVAPVDVWQPSNTYFEPQIADQLSVGYFRSMEDRTYEAFVDVFVKTIQNTLDFKDGSSLVLNKYPETSLLPGKSHAYGAEFSVAKVKGRLQATLNYTFSRSLRQTTSELEDEQINGGSWYASNYDQPHVVQLSWRYGITRRHYFSGNFIYHSGRPMSVPVSFYRVDHVPVLQFSERNAYRIPDYHRLDIAFVIEGNHKRKKLWDGTWAISFYNVYARKNAYSVFYADDGEGILQPYKLSVIGTIVPSLSYSFKL
jgi:hypothetical protein